MNGNKRIFGYVNCAYYNRRAEGDTTWFASAHERDSALERLREDAISHGLSKTAARAGIYPVADRASILSVEAREDITIHIPRANQGQIVEGGQRSWRVLGSNS